MKLTTEQLRKIIKEELKKVIEAYLPGRMSPGELDYTDQDLATQRTRGIESGRITQADLRYEKGPSWFTDTMPRPLPKPELATDRAYNFGMEQKEFAKRASGGSPKFQKVTAQGGVEAYIDHFRDGWKVVYKSPNSEMWFSTIGHESSDAAFADASKNHEIQLGSVDIEDPWGE